MDQKPQEAEKNEACAMSAKSREETASIRDKKSYKRQKSKNDRQNIFIQIDGLAHNFESIRIHLNHPTFLLRLTGISVMKIIHQEDLTKLSTYTSPFTGSDCSSNSSLLSPLCYNKMQYSTFTVMTTSLDESEKPTPGIFFKVV